MRKIYVCTFEWYKNHCSDIEIILNIEMIDVALLFLVSLYGLISGLNSNRLWAQQACRICEGILVQETNKQH